MILHNEKDRDGGNRHDLRVLKKANFSILIIQSNAGGVKMHICNDCKAVFHTPQKHVETHGFTFPPYESFGTCPYCDSDNCEDAEICPECRAYATETELYDGICRECQSKALKEFQRFMTGMSKAQREFLNAEYDGKWF